MANPATARDHGAGDVDSPHVCKVRSRLRARAAERWDRREALRRQALADGEAIARVIAHQYRPQRVWRWGSALRPGGFREYSDVDLAVEGLSGPEAYFAMLREVQGMTDLPLDLVELERIEPEHAEDIRTHGEVLFERS